MLLLFLYRFKSNAVYRIPTYYITTTMVLEQIEINIAVNWRVGYVRSYVGGFYKDILHVETRTSTRTASVARARRRMKHSQNTYYIKRDFLLFRRPIRRFDKFRMEIYTGKVFAHERHHIIWISHIMQYVWSYMENVAVDNILLEEKIE